MHNFLINDPKKFWLHLTRKNDTISKLKLDDAITNDSNRIANAFNDYFSSVFLNATTPPTSFQKTSFTILDLYINKRGIFLALLELDTKKAIGLDGIPNVFLRRYAEWCVKYLQIIFKESLRKAEIPLQWKTVKWCHFIHRVKTQSNQL